MRPTNKATKSVPTVRDGPRGPERLGPRHGKTRQIYLCFHSSDNFLNVSTLNSYLIDIHVDG